MTEFEKRKGNLIKLLIRYHTVASDHEKSQVIFFKSLQLRNHWYRVGKVKSAPIDIFNRSVFNTTQQSWSALFLLEFNYEH